jgi:ankyrin repeat protein
LLESGATPNGQAKDAVAQTDGTGDPLCMTGDKAAAGDTPGRTALSYAAELGSPEMVRLLLDHGADATKADSVGRRASDYVKNRTGDPAQVAKIAEMLK